MICHRWWVVAAWAIAFLIGMWATSGLSSLLTNRFSLPGTDTARAEKILHDHYGQKTVGSFSVVVEGKPGSGARGRQEVGDAGMGGHRGGAVPDEGHAGGDPARCHRPAADWSGHGSSAWATGGGGASSPRGPTPARPTCTRSRGPGRI